MNIQEVRRSLRKRHDKAFAKLVDRPAMGTRRKAAESRMDTSTPCPHCNGTGKDAENRKCQTGVCLTCDGHGRTDTIRAVRQFVCPSCETLLRIDNSVSGWGECPGCALFVTRPRVLWVQESSNGILCASCHGTGDVKTCNGTGKLQLDVLNTSKHVSVKSHGVVATPTSYQAWLKAGRPAHPIYNKAAWNETRYVNGVALPTCGTLEQPKATARHALDCTCIVCHEFKTRIQRPDAVAIPAHVLSPVPYGPWPRPNGLRPPLRSTP